jgi:DNA-binding response OmpR family regulator
MSTNTKKILVVDDDPELMRLQMMRLKAAGYDVVCAADGIAAVATARTEKPDLILLDIGLPGGDGYVVMERLKKLDTDQQTPIIVISAKDPSRP